MLTGQNSSHSKSSRNCCLTETGYPKKKETRKKKRKEETNTKRKSSRKHSRDKKKKRITKPSQHSIALSMGLEWWERYEQIPANKYSHSSHVMHRKLKNRTFQLQIKIRDLQIDKSTTSKNQSSTNVDKHMTSVILSPSIQTRLKIQRKSVHQKDNRNQEGVYNKHTWKHFIPVRKSPLVFVFSDFFPLVFFVP